MSSKKSKRNKTQVNCPKTLLETTENILAAVALADASLHPAKPITPEKQAYLDRRAKRTKALAKVKSQRHTRKTGIVFVSAYSNGEAPCTYMVERKAKS